MGVGTREEGEQEGGLSCGISRGDHVHVYASRGVHVRAYASNRDHVHAFAFRGDHLHALLYALHAPGCLCHTWLPVSHLAARVTLSGVLSK